jgi:hypothetical protein
MDELAAIQIVWMSNEDSSRRENWEKAVAIALRSEKQQELDLLFIRSRCRIRMVLRVLLRAITRDKVLVKLSG